MVTIELLAREIVFVRLACRRQSIDNHRLLTIDCHFQTDRSKAIEFTDRATTFPLIAIRKQLIDRC